jgi:hypothetical protein
MILSAQVENGSDLRDYTLLSLSDVVLTHVVLSANVDVSALYTLIKRLDQWAH